MVTHYKCKSIKCDLRNVLVQHVRALIAPDGEGKICSSCNCRLIIAKTVNTSGGGPRGGGPRNRSRSSSR